MKRYILTLDQGTTSSRAILFDDQQNIIAMAQNETHNHYPHNGWVEQDAYEIWATQSGVMNEVIAKADIKPEQIKGIAITNQRETMIVWDKLTGAPIYPAIVWQCRRSAQRCEELKENYQEMIQAKTGLHIDAYFSATKLEWILNNVEGAKERAARGELLMGTVDTWLLYKLTGGAVHATDYTNASRTMLFNIHDLNWDEELLELFSIPLAMLPQVYDSAHIYGNCNIQGVSIPIASMVGDQQSALFGQKCFKRGDVKNTYGTGCFMLMNTGQDCVKSQHGLISTIGIAYEGKIHYALEGSVFIGGAVVQWLRDGMEMFEKSVDIEALAASVNDNGGIYMVPSFTGLGAPYWQMEATGTIFGLTRAASKAHIARAALESIAYQSYDVLKAMEKDAGMKITHLRVDGGASQNQFLMQFQADLMQASICRHFTTEITSLGAYYLAALKLGFFASMEDIPDKAVDHAIEASMDDKKRQVLLDKWHHAVKTNIYYSKSEDITEI